MHNVLEGEYPIPVPIPIFIPISAPPAATCPTTSYGLANFATIAGLYSQLAGVLAGFAFAGLVALIAARLAKDKWATKAAPSLAPLVAAMISLVASSLNYGIVAGEDFTRWRSTVLETAGGIGFCTAGLMLFYAAWLLLSRVANITTSHSAYSSSASLARRSLTVGLIPLIMFLLYAGVADQNVLRYGNLSAPPGCVYTAPMLQPIDYLGIGLALALFLQGLVLWPIGNKAYTPAVPALQRTLPVAAVFISLASVVLVVAIVIWQSPSSLGSELVTYAELIILFSICSALSYVVSAQ